jgi:hypothetical protein
MEGSALSSLTVGIAWEEERKSFEVEAAPCAKAQDGERVGPPGINS